MGLTRTSAWIARDVWNEAKHRAQDINGVTLDIEIRRLIKLYVEGKVTIQRDLRPDRDPTREARKFLPEKTTWDLMKELAKERDGVSASFALEFMLWQYGRGKLILDTDPRIAS
ncbi:hypothetical protein AB0O47_39915 [Streptomyces noursei]|uniref:hypothetical protein n=1 Tax=Streptomyces noursei TaxID=1971 RepID=UPI00344FFDE1